MKRNCWNCACFDPDTYPIFIDDEIGEVNYEIIYICEKGTEASESIMFPYDKDMECFEEWS